MPRKRDEVAYFQATRRSGLPECVHVPVAAVDEQAIIDHIGDVREVLSPGKALLVAVDPPPPRDLRLPIWRLPTSEVLFESTQVWVSPSYTRYRPAYIKAKGPESVAGLVLSHVVNRRHATLRGYGYVRVVPISRQANSSSVFSEQWPLEDAPWNDWMRKPLRQRIRYADLSDLMLLLDMRIGGGVMDAVRIAMDLVGVPGLRPPQSAT